MSATTETRPTLWQIAISHYSEKARWALDYKGVEYDSRSPLAGIHIPIALWLTRGTQATFPVLELDGGRIGDSTAIIAALEKRFPEPALYPDDPEQLRRALALEDYFDEELGPHIRLLVFHELGNDPDRFAEVAAAAAPGPLKKVKSLAGSYARTFTGLRFRVRSPEAAERARVKVLAALDRLDAELGSGEYLVGDRFSSADLSAASLFYPLVSPPEGPMGDGEMPDAFERFREPLKERRSYQWVEEMFHRHRRPMRQSAQAAQ